MNAVDVVLRVRQRRSKLGLYKLLFGFGLVIRSKAGIAFRLSLFFFLSRHARRRWIQGDGEQARQIEHQHAR